MPTMKPNLEALMEAKQERDGLDDKLTLYTVAKEMTERFGGQNTKGMQPPSLYSSLWKFQNDQMRQYPRELLMRLKLYFECSLDDLFVIVEGDEAQAGQAAAEQERKKKQANKPRKTKGETDGNA